jgi:hypothetical protein
MLHLMETSYDSTEEFQAWIESVASEFEVDPIEVIALIEEELGASLVELHRLGFI